MNEQERQQERKQWEDLPEIYIRLHKDELGYPPGQWEQLKVEQTQDPDIFRIKNIPFYARGLAWEDEVCVTTSEEGYYPVFNSVVKRSGYSTVRLWISEGEERQELIDYFTKRETFLEFNGRLVALAIPRQKYDEVMEHVCNEKDKGRWGAEDGFLIVDEQDSIGHH